MSAHKLNAKHAKAAWRARSVKKEKPWGEELQWAGHNFIHGKVLYIRAGERTSFKYHKLKAESLLILRGKAKILYGDEYSLYDSVGHPLKEEIFEAGEGLLVQSACPYRIEAIEDCEVIEIGNNGADMPVRIEDDYGRTTKSD
jgi:mannose-6-phosphate isomerase